MAGTIQVSSIFKTLGARVAEAHNAVKDIPVNMGGGVGLPPGINNGVAMLSVMEFIEGKKDEDKGKFYFRAAGVMKLPEFHDGIKVKGKQTSVLIPFFDTPKRQGIKSFSVPNKEGKSHWNTYRDLFAKLGVLPPPPQQPGESTDAYGARLQAYYVGAQEVLLPGGRPDPQKPVYFELRTWQPDKVAGEREPGIFELWGVRCEYKETGAAINPAAGVGPAPSANGQPAAVAPPAAPPSPPAAAPSPAIAPVLTELELRAHAETADADSDLVTDEAKASSAAISEEAKRVGITDAEAGPLDWAGVVGLILARRGGGAAPVVSPPGGRVYAKGDKVMYSGAQREVTSVNAEAKTATLKNVSDGKSVVGDDKKLLKVPFDQLSPAA